MTIGESLKLGLVTYSIDAGNTFEVGGAVTADSAESGWLARSGHVPLGYYGDPAKTARTFPEIDGVRYGHVIDPRSERHLLDPTGERSAAGIPLAPRLADFEGRTHGVHTRHPVAVGAEHVERILLDLVVGLALERQQADLGPVPVGDDDLVLGGDRGDLRDRGPDVAPLGGHVGGLAAALRLAELGKTLIVTSHILPELSRICDQVAILTHGQLQAFGTLEEILVGPAYENDGRRNLFGGLRGSMATTGYATADFDQWPPLSRVLLLLAMMIGGESAVIERITPVLDAIAGRIHESVLHGVEKR